MELQLLSDALCVLANYKYSVCMRESQVPSVAEGRTVLKQTGQKNISVIWLLVQCGQQTSTG